MIVARTVYRLVLESAMPSHLIVIGASAGGLEVVTQVLADLPRDFPAPIFVVIHTGAEVPGVLSQIFERAGPLPADYAVEGEKIVPGRVFIAPPDHHLLIERGKVRVTRGPRENGFRPAIDPLFRTAAASYGARVIGVILSGGLDDGTSGLSAIKRAGGTAIVQDPKDATLPGMPASARRHVKVDHVLPGSKIGAALIRLTSLRELSSLPSRDDSPDTAEVGTDRLDSGRSIEGTPSSFTCPECGGVLREVQENGVSRFECHVGHAYSIETLARGQAESLEHALWIALRSLEEGAALRRSMAEKARQRSTSGTLSNWMDEQAEEWEARAAIVRRALVTDKETGETGSAAAVADRARRAGEK
jgi:two-component system chemotaxis response regulator CheB